MGGMILGIPKEIKAQEYRVALTPEAVGRLVRGGHRVLVQGGAGKAWGYPDQEFRDNGAVILSSAAAVWKGAELILKVKEPFPKEYSFFRPGLFLFTYLHLASAPSLAKALMKRQVTAFGYETVTAPDGSLPLLRPMSRIAGKLSVLIGAEHLRTDRGERGVLLSPVEGAKPGRILILGAGNVGRAALEIGHGIGAKVTMIDRSEERLNLGPLSAAPRFGTVETMVYEPQRIAELLAEIDLLIGAVLIAGDKGPELIR